MRTQVRPEDWSRTTRALRHLATELVGGREQREDLVQCTLVAALERPPRSLSWSWLASVLENRARDLVRTRQRRGSAEELPVLQSSTPDATEIAQRLELQEDLTRALRTLEEPYQRTLYLRYFEDLTPSEIARQRGEPVKTIKTRLERGLERLRQRLEHRHGPDLRALLPLAFPLSSGLTTSIASATKTGGLLIMWKKIALVAALLLAGLLLWRAERSGGIEPTVAIPSTAAPASLDRSEQDASGVAGLGTVEAREPSAAPESIAAKTETSRFGTLTVLLRWNDGTPAAGIAVDFRRQVPSAPSSMRGLFRATSDDEGRANSGELLPGRVSVTTGRGNSKTVDVVAAEAREVVIDLADGVDVEGRVLDGRGTPVANAEIWLTSAYVDWLGMSAVARSDSNGIFHLRDVQAAQSLGAIAQGFAPSKLVDLELLEAHDGRVEIELRVTDPGGALQGQVSDARGAAVQGANVCVGIGAYDDIRADGTFAELWAPRQARTDGEGRFRFEGLPAASVPVSVKSATSPQWTGAIDVRAGATVELAVVLEDTATLGGVVRDAKGAPVKRALVRAFKKALSPNFIAMGQYDDPSVFGSPIAVADANGAYELENIWLGEVHAYASPPRKMDALTPEFHAEAVLHPAAGEHVEWNPVLEPGRTIRGHTLFADGVAMTSVFVRATDESTQERRSLNVGDGGRFEFFSLPPGPFRLDVQLLPPLPNSRPLFKTGVFPDGVELELVADFPSPEKNPSAKVRGRFADPLGRFAKPLSPMLDAAGGSGYFGDRNDESGFEFRELAAGHYRILGYMGEEIGFVGEAFDLRAGEELDLGTLVVPAGAALTVRLRRAPSLEQAKISAYFHPRETLRGTLLDFSNSDEVAFTNLTLGTYVLRLRGGTEAAQVLRTFELKGDMLLELPVRPCLVRKIEIEFSPEAARGDLHLTIQEAGGETIEDSTYFSGWNKRSPYQVEFGLPPGHFTVHAQTSTGLVADGELDVELPGKPAEPLRLALH